MMDLDPEHVIAWARARGARAATIAELARLALNPAGPSALLHLLWPPPLEQSQLDADFFIPENNAAFGVEQARQSYVLNHDPERRIWSVGPAGDLRDLPHRVKHIELLAALLRSPGGIAGTHLQAASINRLLQRQIRRACPAVADGLRVAGIGDTWLELEGDVREDVRFEERVLRTIC